VKDGLVRCSIKAVARAAFSLNLWADRGWRRARGAKPFVLGGGCERCARCCEAPAIRVHSVVLLAPLLRRSFLWWHERVNGFVLAETRPRDRTFVFRCTHFDAAARSCDTYASRPGMCRDYPRSQLFQPQPAMLAGCGYRPVARNAARILRVLQDQTLSDAQRERLARELHLQ